MVETHEGSVLVVDANRSRASTVAGILSRRSETQHARSAQEALALADEMTDLAAVVVDRDLPDLDGFDAVELLSENHDLHDVRKIVVAATEDDQAAKRSVEAHCDAYFVESDPVARAEMAAFTIALLGLPSSN